MYRFGGVHAEVYYLVGYAQAIEFWGCRCVVGELEIAVGREFHGVYHYWSVETHVLEIECGIGGLCYGAVDMEFLSSAGGEKERYQDKREEGGYCFFHFSFF